MSVLLDTAVLIELLQEKRFEEGAILIITLIEILGGLPPEKRPEVKDTLERSFALINLDNRVVEAYCRLYQQLKRAGRLLSDVGILIGATARAYNLPLETRDENLKRVVEALGLS
jgi:predicted nucleic acid-binding protein